MQENDISRHVCEIMEKWEACRPLKTDGGATSVVDVEDRLVKLLGSQTLATAAPKQYTDVEKKIRQAILSQYSELSDDEVCTKFYFCFNNLNILLPESILRI